MKTAVSHKPLAVSPNGEVGTRNAERAEGMVRIGPLLLDEFWLLSEAGFTKYEIHRLRASGGRHLYLSQGLRIAKALGTAVEQLFGPESSEISNLKSTETCT